MDPRSTPQRVLLAHSPDEVSQFAINPRSSRPLSRFPAPVAPEPCSMPSQDSCWLNYLDRAEQTRPPRMRASSSTLLNRQLIVVMIVPVMPNYDDKP